MNTPRVMLGVALFLIGVKVFLSGSFPLPLIGLTLIVLGAVAVLSGARRPGGDGR